jgi:tetratricopeptide (TPR) repeat protein
MNSRSKRSLEQSWLFPLVLALAILVRIIYLYQYHASPVWEQLTVDNWYHHHWAQSLASGNILGDTTYFRAPLYVYCLGLLYAIFGDSFWVGRLFGLVIGMASIGITYVLARRFIGARWAAVAAALQAFLPIVIYFESELLLDPLFMLMLQVAVWRALVWLDSRRDRDLLLTGLAFGLAAVCRPTALAPAFVVLLWALGAKRLNGSWLSRAGIFSAGVLLCIAPIFVRNLVVAGDPVLIASQDGINLYIGNNTQADGLSAVLPEPLGHNWQIKQITHIAEKKTGRRLKPGEVSAYWRARALDWIRSHPGESAALWGKKLVYQFGNREISNNRSLQTHFSSFGLLSKNPLSFGVLFPLAILGAVAAWRRHAGVRLIVFIVAVHVIAAAFFFFSSRFRLPVMPFFCLLAAGGLAWMWQQRSRHFMKLVVAVIVLVGLGWLSFRPPIAYPDAWSVQSLVSRGLMHFTKGEMPAALASFRQAAEIRPDFPEVHLNLGATFLKMGQLDSAEVLFEREIGLHPDRFKAYQNLATVKLLHNDAASARSLAEQALSLAPYDIMSNLVWLRALGSDSAIDRGRLPSSIEQAARASEDDVEVLSEGATILVARGDCEAAMPFLLRARESMPPPIETDDQAFSPSFHHGTADYERLKAGAFYLLGYCHGQQGQIPESIECSRAAIAADSTMAAAYVNLRTGYLSQGRLREADSVLAEATRRFPHDELMQSLKTPHP